MLSPHPATRTKANDANRLTSPEEICTWAKSRPFRPRSQNVGVREGYVLSLQGLPACVKAPAPRSGCASTPEAIFREAYDSHHHHRGRRGAPTDRASRLG